jgi:hypothetical protein
MDNVRIGALCRALEQRLAEVAAKIKNKHEEFSIKTVFYAQVHNDSEECLRELMVKYYPRIKSGKADKRDGVEIFSLLNAIKDQGLSEDMRFLDAYNNAYEAICDAGWESTGYSEYVGPFYKQYHHLLLAHLDRLRT